MQPEQKGIHQSQKQIAEHEILFFKLHWAAKLSKPRGEGLYVECLTVALRVWWAKLIQGIYYCLQFVWDEGWDCIFFLELGF